MCALSGASVHVATESLTEFVARINAVRRSQTLDTHSTDHKITCLNTAAATSSRLCTRLLKRSTLNTNCIRARMH